MTQPNRTRALALVGPLEAERRITQTKGFPIDPSKIPPAPDVILLIAAHTPGAMLFRYTAHGELCGDTPHSTVAEAERQAVIEYGEALFPWLDVPADIADVHAFAIQYAADELNERDK